MCCRANNSYTSLVRINNDKCETGILMAVDIKISFLGYGTSTLKMDSW